LSTYLYAVTYVRDREISDFKTVKAKSIDEVYENETLGYADFIAIKKLFAVDTNVLC
jgi:hypothetical protein